jgi:beta-galactosidase
MSRIAFNVVLIALCAAAAALPARAGGADTSPRERMSIDAGWRFHRGEPDEMQVPDREQFAAWSLPSGNAFIANAARRHTRPAGNPGGELPWVRGEFDDSGWQKITLPHDWAIDAPFLTSGEYGGMGRLPSWGVGWYRKDLDIPARDAGRSIFLDVGGAMSYAAVWLNGRFVGGWPYGYNSWRLDLTPYVVPGGANRLAIRLDNPPESSRWYPGGGLYRNVWLTKTDPVHVGQWGTHITTKDVSAAAATVGIAVTIDNDGLAAASVDVATEIHTLGTDSRPGPVVATIAPAGVRIKTRASGVAQGETTIDKPKLWGPPPNQVPNRYLAVTTVRRDGKVVDRYQTPFGIRDIRFDPDRGVIVNGERIPLQGVNQHHDLGALGAAFNVRAAERQLEILRDMGVNAIRTAHNPPAPELLELTDRMGLLVIDEIFDVWRMAKTPNDFHLIFDDWHEPDLRAFLRRDRNHPSVILWSVGNEVGEQLAGADGAAIAKRLVAIAHEEDPDRPVMASMNSADADMPFPAALDVIALNYQGVGVRTLPSDFPAFRRQFPDRLIFSSESAAALSSRGEFQFPVAGSTSAPVRPGVGGDPDTHQVSAYGIYAADFGSSPDLSFSLHDQYPFVAGEFVWSGFDYLGEPTPYYESRSSYFGIVDLAGFPKDSYYLYQSRWRPDLPMAHIIPHWTWPDRVGQVTPVHVYTSGDEAELFVNGVSQGRRKKAPYQYRLRWDYVVYEPGEVKVVAYKNGREWATETLRTAGSPTGLEATADRKTIDADGRDLAFVTVRVADGNGLTAPRANNKIEFNIEGPGEIVATDNGDPTSFVPFRSSERDAFNGLALAIVRGIPGRPGTITLHAASESLAGDSVTLVSKTAE